MPLNPHSVWPYNISRSSYIEFQDLMIFFTFFILLAFLAWSNHGCLLSLPLNWNNLAFSFFKHHFLLVQHLLWCLGRLLLSLSQIRSLLIQLLLLLLCFAQIFSLFLFLLLLLHLLIMRRRLIQINFKHSENITLDVLKNLSVFFIIRAICINSFLTFRVLFLCRWPSIRIVFSWLNFLLLLLLRVDLFANILQSPLLEPDFGKQVII